MDISIKKELLTSDYKYTIYSGLQVIYTATANRTVVPYLRKVFIFNSEGQEQCSVRQENLLRFILQKLFGTIIFKRNLCPYKVYEDGKNKGFMKERSNQGACILGQINGDNYELYLHSGNSISIWCNGKQVGLVEKTPEVKFENDIYTVRFSKSLETLYATMFCLLSDLLWFNIDLSFDVYKIEYTHKFYDNNFDQQWVPEE
jgi:hypothetical protein